jgi:hypothetical protein
VSRFFSPSTIRFVSSFLIAVIILQAAPRVAVAAPSRPAEDGVRGQAPSPTVAQKLAQVAADLRGDLACLAAQGKEAFLDRFYDRLDADEARAHDAVVREVKRVGARRLGMLILGIGSPVLAAMLSVIPESWQEAIVVSTLKKFISKSLREVREALASTPAAVLKVGLEGMLRLVGDPRFARGEALSGDSWWEKFFGNSTIVRNFLIVVVTLAAIGVAVGLAIAGSTVGPVVAVVGALVALVALLNGSVPGLH